MKAYMKRMTETAAKELYDQFTEQDIRTEMSIHFFNYLFLSVRKHDQKQIERGTKENLNGKAEAGIDGDVQNADQKSH